MKAAGGVAAFANAAALIFCCDEVETYRPFDATDAAVAETGEMEIELGRSRTFGREPSVRCWVAILGSTAASSPAGKPH